MSALILEEIDGVFIITLNRVEKHNALDSQMIDELRKALDKAIKMPTVRVILLKANGKHFSAGADINWMKKVTHMSQQENFDDAYQLALLIHKIYSCPKPTIALVQGCAYGGGSGIISACDIVFAGKTSFFVFPEARLGLIPAIISPYVVEAIGVRAAKYFFLTTEPLQVEEAKHFGLIHEIIDDQILNEVGLEKAKKLATSAPIAMKEIKSLVRKVTHAPIDDALLRHTAGLIAEKRVSPEGQEGLAAYLEKREPVWNINPHD